MYPFFRLLPHVLLCLAMGASLTQAASYPEIKRDAQGKWAYPIVCFTAKSGDWDNAKNWEGGKMPVPPLPRINVNAGSTLTIDKPVKFPISVLLLGSGKSRGSCHVIFRDDAKLQVDALWLPNGVRKDSQAEFLMEGGELIIGEARKATIFLEDFFLGVGHTSTASGNGRFVMTRGSLIIHSGLRVGALMPRTNVGVFCVKGSAPSVTLTAQNPGGLSLRPSGTLEFVLDEKGVAGIQADKACIDISDGGLIRADGTAYRGPTKQFVLLNGAKITNADKAHLETVGFPSEYDAKITVEKNRVILKVDRTQ